MIKRVESFSYEERLRTETVQPREGKTQVDLLASTNIRCKGAKRTDSALFSGAQRQDQRADSMGKVEIGGHLGHSDHEVIEFKISVDRRKSASKTSALDMRRENFKLLREFSEEVPYDWKLVNAEGFKKDKKEDHGNYKPVSLLSVPSKIMEEIILEGIEKQLKDNTVIGHSQHSFLRVKSRLSNLCSFYDKGSILGPVLFNIFVKDLDTGLEGILSKFTDDTKLGGAADSLKGKEVLQRDFNKLEDWAITNHMNFSKGKCCILHLGQGILDIHKLGNKMLESSATESSLGVLDNDKLNMSQQCPGSQEGQ
ncbi:hypothetical protein WISP_136290 [Willisornis vidua]|uniref:Reverse transcriptase domain-containing protein n=1 Tax=Willisornis vidua TaxID=1566151 RepID=A0ABQ9CND7_9PASS|nr:hypothetical protein WISP_136290 [Willisornis vidua]